MSARASRSLMFQVCKPTLGIRAVISPVKHLVASVGCHYPGVAERESKWTTRIRKHLSPFLPKLHKYVTTGGPRHLNRLKVALPS